VGRETEVFAVGVFEDGPAAAELVPLDETDPKWPLPPILQPSPYLTAPAESVSRVIFTVPRYRPPFGFCPTQSYVPSSDVGISGWVAASSAPRRASPTAATAPATIERVSRRFIGCSFGVGPAAPPGREV
jgi:hypothetical protein